MGSRIILPLNTINKIGKIPAYARSRKTPLQILRNYRETDLFEFELPKNMPIEALPDSVEMATDFCVFRFDITIEGNIIRYKRVFEL